MIEESTYDDDDYYDEDDDYDIGFKLLRLKRRNINDKKSLLVDITYI